MPGIQEGFAPDMGGMAGRGRMHLIASLVTDHAESADVRQEAEKPIGCLACLRRGLAASGCESSRADILVDADIVVICSIAALLEHALSGR